MKAGAVAERWVTHLVKGEELFLLPQRAIYWPKRQSLMVADLHLGKSTFFRQHGLNVPVEVLQHDLDTLDEIFSIVDVKRLILLGDLFHSSENAEWELFGDWLDAKFLDVHLVMGNHDRLKESCYFKFGINVHKRLFTEAPFIFSHKQVKKVKAGHYVFSGHIHPAIGMHGRAYNSVRVPCFWFGEDQCVLPAFGKFTGNESIKPLSGDKIFAIAGSEVMGM